MFWFVRLFALYLSVLGCLSCADFEPISASSQATFQSADAQNSKHHTCNDPCSPLCQCARCGCVTIAYKVPPLTLPLTSLLREAVQMGFTYQGPYSSPHLTALFRPPIVKLG